MFGISIDNVEVFIHNYGYWVVVFGGLIEGEVIILTAAALASKGLLSIKYVTLFAFLGTTLSYQLLFLVGARWGVIWKQNDSFGRARDKIRRLVFAYPKVLLMTIRFIAGARTITPIVMGSVGFPSKDFFALNVIAAAVWASIMCGLGYFYGKYVLNMSYLVMGCLIVVYMTTVFMMHRWFERL